MTVVRDLGQGNVECYWFEGPSMYEGIFPQEALQNVPDKNKSRFLDTMSVTWDKLIQAGDDRFGKERILVDADVVISLRHAGRNEKILSHPVIPFQGSFDPSAKAEVIETEPPNIDDL